MGFKVIKMAESVALYPLATCDNIEGNIHHFEFWTEATPAAVLVFVSPAAGQAGQIACDEACAHEILCGPHCSKELATCSTDKGAVIAPFDDYLTDLLRRIRRA